MIRCARGLVKLTLVMIMFGLVCAQSDWGDDGDSVQSRLFDAVVACLTQAESLDTTDANTCAKALAAHARRNRNDSNALVMLEQGLDDAVSSLLAVDENVNSEFLRRARLFHSVRLDVLRDLRRVQASSAPSRIRDDYLAERIRSRFEGVTGPVDTSITYWQQQQQRLINHIGEDDLSGFLRWATVTDVPIAECDGGYSDEVNWWWLTNRSDFATRWEPVLSAESSVGNPCKSAAHPTCSYALVRHAMNLARFEDWLGKKVEEMDFIFEFGGGAAGMASLIHELGFNGTYLMLDFPAVSALQEFYLRSLALPVVSPPKAGKVLGPAVITTDDITIARNVIEANMVAPRFSERSLFVSTWALSESPGVVRDPVAAMILPFRHHFIIYQHAFYGLNNKEFFGQMTGKTTANKWHDEEMPRFQFNNWLFGTTTMDGRTPINVTLDVASVVTKMPMVVKVAVHDGVGEERFGMWMDGTFVGAASGHSINMVMEVVRDGEHTIMVDLIAGVNEPVGLGVEKTVVVNTSGAQPDAGDGSDSKSEL